ncbi:hypothetical protein PF005_g10052 [Phytophthora fragariae]|uniref:Uncharacterized protein n=2 Tax=Phytophthora TaxID=4783 RepID=A0A6A3Y866_9STRA|nr:hypothetical protein PF003_g20254 [Phytophthora fragariae]KAE9036732.1 hypothetical protein PR001_g8687 [Phytophthora rubi]KAE8939001.1 hypothetical protein PF009_g11138 [Phytophthora fragariae]KAE9012652.1 hypothetical protein PF011_g8825 [Phytophthora fragariae]KAE9115042.1 hypothetical protein PF007_g10158 [Phytophthora fragariae]
MVSELTVRRYVDVNDGVAIEWAGSVDIEAIDGVKFHGL